MDDNKLIGLSYRTMALKSLETDVGRREVVAVVSDGSIDRDDEVVIPAGLVKKDYNRVSVFLNHAYTRDPSALPIGSVRWLKRAAVAGEDALIAKMYFSDATEDARNSFQLIADKDMSVGYSIGFEVLQQSRPTQEEIKTKGWGTVKKVIRSFSVHEISVTGIPANENTRTLLAAKGYGAAFLTLLGLPASVDESAAVISVPQQHEGMTTAGWLELYAKTLPTLLRHL